jgi:hypothetical protein
MTGLHHRCVGVKNGEDVVVLGTLPATIDYDAAVVDEGGVQCAGVRKEVVDRFGPLTL